MTYENAKALISAQERSLRKVNGFTFSYKGYDFRVKYFGGFAAYIGIDYRQTGKRNYKYFGGIGGYKYLSSCDALDAVRDEVVKKIG